jgi:MHS family proline/betaine transporter-like MFS transporter
MTPRQIAHTAQDMATQGDDMIVRAASSQVNVATLRRRAVVATTIGNTLEWFDFVMFGFLAPTMAKVFFPATDEKTGLLLAFATFGVPFLVRPLGAIVLGAYADRKGRRAALSLTIALMSLGTALLAITPGYTSFGILAPLLVVVARILQGLSAGGEFGSATAFLAEQDPARRGFFSSWQFASQGATTVLATGFGIALTGLLTPEQLESWGWRIPFACGALLGPVAYYIRTQLSETAEFRSITTHARPLQTVLTTQLRELTLCAGLAIAATVSAYTMLFMPTFAAKQLGVPSSQAFAASLLGGVLQLVIVPIIGALSDRYGRTRFSFFSALGILVCAYPLFAHLVGNPSFQTLLYVQTSIGLLVAVYLGALGGLICDLFPPQTRTSGVSIGNAIAVTIFGGFAPVINSWLIAITGNNAAPSFYLSLGAALSLLAHLGLRKRMHR